MTSISEMVFIVSKEHPEGGIDPSKLEVKFQKNKQELDGLIDELKKYVEIEFDSEIEMKIRNWELETFETEAELTDWQKNFSEYIGTLDINII